MKQELFYVWLMPDQKNQRQFKKIADSLSDEFGTIPIEPHLSLLMKVPGNEKEFIQKAGELAKPFSQIQIQLEKIDELPDMSRCIFWKAASSPLLDNARKESERIFHTLGVREFMPHITLLYAQMESEKKKPLIEKVVPLVPKECVLDSLWIVKDSGTFGVWPKIAEFSLK